MYWEYDVSLSVASISSVSLFICGFVGGAINAMMGRMCVFPYYIFFAHYIVCPNFRSSVSLSSMKYTLGEIHFYCNTSYSFRMLYHNRYHQKKNKRLCKCYNTT